MALSRKRSQRQMTARSQRRASRRKARTGRPSTPADSRDNLARDIAGTLLGALTGGRRGS